MPLTETDVLDTLKDPTALGIEFYVDNIHISGSRLGTVGDNIRNGNILVVGGTADLAFYDQASDTLTTQQKSPPANDSDRALLLHECVHAMIDIYYPDNDVTRHMGEIAAYLVQTAYSLRKNPAANRNGTAPWDKFWGDLYSTARLYKLDTPAGNGVRIFWGFLENLRQQLAVLPGVNYGNYSRWATDVSNGLKRNNSFRSEELITMRTTSVSYETVPDLSDDYLIRVLMERYAALDVPGYGNRLNRLRRDFLRCSVIRAANLRTRLRVRIDGDRLSEAFFGRLSHGGRSILLSTLALPR